MKKLYYTLAYFLLLGLPSLFLLKAVNINTKSLVITIVAVIVVGGIFDFWATKNKKRDKFFIWEYNEKSILGLKIRNVPIEDFVLFLVLTPIFIISLSIPF